MDGRRKYLRCRQTGRGIFTDRFTDPQRKLSVIDVSATGIGVISKIDINVGEIVSMAIVFDGYFHEKDLKVQGCVIRKEMLKDGFLYGIEFINQSHKEKVEIDEIMNRSCIRDHHKTLSNCEEDCTFLK
ncbi:MAG: PilZ domain-containing protein [Clostridiaceae bacterium]|nr:PilZ domain-containing protein [Clostridiaceae bacterium]